MNEYIRGYNRISHEEGNYPTSLWREIQNAVREAIGTKPFDTTPPKDYDEFNYLPSHSRTTRFELVDGHSRYQPDHGFTKYDRELADKKLGPVEVDILSFASSQNPQLCVLVGGMGSGKTTTLKYLKSHYLKNTSIVFCDLDSCIDVSKANSDGLSDIDVAVMLTRSLSFFINHLILPEKEWKNLWTWGLSPEAGRDHPAKNILSDAASKLRSELGNDWLSESEDAIKIRKNCLREIICRPVDFLTYQALCIDYYLTCESKDDRSNFLIIFDNIDPLPPRAQYQIKEFASRLQTSAHCKILLSMRPLTYSSNFQSANRTVEVIEHIGPSIVALIEHRIQNGILNTDMPNLAVKIHEDSREQVINQQQAKEWITAVLTTIKQQRNHPQPLGDPNANLFIDGLCGHSLRSALIIGPKIFGSKVIPILGTIGEVSSNPHRSHVKDHDVIRAILEGWHSHFQARQGRITDNLFDLGVDVSSRSCTSKVRILNKLAESNNGIVSLGELRQHLSCFGYESQVILDTVNSIISQTKRLAWSDSVSQYPTLDGFQSTKLKISDAGRFYINYAMYNLEYVQAVHVDVLLPKEETLEHDPRNFVDRIRSLELFIRYLNDQDKKEVLRVLYNNAACDYNCVYKAKLFSIDIIHALKRQIENVGRSLLAGKPSDENKISIEKSIRRWDDLLITIKRNSSDIVKKLVQSGC